MFQFLKNLELRWKMLVVLLPLVIIPILTVVSLIGAIALEQVDSGITRASKREMDLHVTTALELLQMAAQEQHSVPYGNHPLPAELKQKIKSRKVGQTGYLFCMNNKGTFTVHPDAEGQNFFDATDTNGHHFIREMCTRKNGWIRYPWASEGASRPRMKIVRYAYFEPWDWIVAIGAYEDEFYHESNIIKWQILASLMALTILASLVSVALFFIASRKLTDPLHHMIEVIRSAREGNLARHMEVDSRDELGEMAQAFNHLTSIIARNKEMEASLAQQGKMASLGVLSSGVAHEINNPLGVILGYAGYVEGKVSKDDPIYHYIHEIKRESKRCKKIVQDLLSYARTPKPTFEQVDLNDLLDQIIDFSANHTDMRQITIIRDLCSDLPQVSVDADQIRQVAINLILNAGGAMTEGGVLRISSAWEDDSAEISFCDNGEGISTENLEKIFEPFFTTKARGTGLGLAITRQIIEQHQGSIRIESTPGEGTTVTVRLPISQEGF